MEGKVFLLVRPNKVEYGILKCIDSATMQEDWSTELKSLTTLDWQRATAFPYHTEHGVYYSGCRVVFQFCGHLISMDPFSGVVCWEFESIRTLACCCSHDTIYVGVSDQPGIVRALDAVTGEIKWEWTAGAEEMATIQRLHIAKGKLVLQNNISASGIIHLIVLDRYSGQVTGRLARTKEKVILGGKEVGAVFDAKITDGGERMLVLSGEGLASYRLSDMKLLWQNADTGNFSLPERQIRDLLPEASYPTQRPLRLMEVKGSICAIGDYRYGVRIYDLASGEKLSEITPPEGAVMSDWFLDGSWLETSVPQPNPKYAFDIKQTAYNLTDGKERFRNTFPTGRFMMRPIPVGDKVIFAKEDRINGRVEIIIYSSVDGHKIGKSLGLDGMDYVPNCDTMLIGDILVVKGKRRIVAVKLKELKE
jgi:hypothetical protein